MDDDEINLLDYWRVLVKRRRLMVKIVVGAFVASVVISLALPKVYTAETVILAAQSENRILSSLTMGMETGPSAPSFFFGQNEVAKRWEAILRSRSVLDVILKLFGLVEVFEAETQEDARKSLEDMVDIKTSKNDTLSIAVTDEEPKRAADIANALVQALDTFNKKTVMTSGGRAREFIEKRLAEVKKDLAREEEALRAFKEQNKSLEVTAQAGSIAAAVGAVQGQLMAKEVELETLLSYATSHNPRVDLIRNEVAGLQRSLRELESGRRGDRVGGTVFVPLEEVPGLSLQYARLVRNAAIQGTLYEVLAKQYEIARIQEAQDTPTIRIIDHAVVPEKKSGPRRALIVLLATFTAGFFAVFTAFFLEWLERTKQPLAQASPQAS